MSSTTEVSLDPVESSRLAGLRYVSDAKPGITRKRRGKSFQYFDPDGKAIRNKDEIARIKSLAIPRHGRMSGSVRASMDISRQLVATPAAANRAVITRDGARYATKTSTNA